MSVTSMMVSLATIQRKVQAVVSATGAVKPTWALAATGVSCDLQSDTSGEGLKHSRETGQRAVTGYFPWGTDIRNGDRVIGTSGPFAGFIGEVVGVPFDRSGRSSHLEVPILETKGGGTT